MNLENVRNPQRSKNESHSAAEGILFQLHYNSVYFIFIILYCSIRGASFTTHTPKTPRLHTFVIFTAVCKRIKICYKGTDRFVADPTVHVTHRDITSVAIDNCKNVSESKVGHLCPVYPVTTSSERRADEA
jgi:hypothetical protein